MIVKMTNIKFKKFLKWIDYRVNDSAPFQWKCFGENAMFFNHISDDKQASICAIVDLKDQTVYEVNVTRSDPEMTYVAFRWFHPDYKKAYFKEAKKRGVSAKQAWDAVDFTDTADVSVIKGIIKTLMKEPQK